MEKRLVPMFALLSCHVGLTVALPLVARGEKQATNSPDTLEFARVTGKDSRGDGCEKGFSHQHAAGDVFGGAVAPGGALGYPSRDPQLDVRPGFQNPPNGYGVVPFYWWLGDPLTKERLAWQLDQLTEHNGIVGLQINYAHSDKGGAAYGLTYPSEPALFSPAWWDLFDWWARECNKRGIAVSLSDYTLGVAGQGWWIDEILREDASLHGAVLECTTRSVQGPIELAMDVPENTVSVMAYRTDGGAIASDSAVDLRSKLNGRSLKWQAPAANWQVMAVHYRVVPTSVDPLNRKLGPQIVEHFFKRFEDHLPGEAGRGLNFFFSDELTFGVSGKLWTAGFAEEFAKRKGYDLLSCLPALFADVGPATPKVRLDYNDVLVCLTEEAYYKPIFRWHYERGMLYGCDHGGRGTNVVEFGDYFRTQRWTTGPGCDAPGLSTDVIKDKVASSISHLYQRPRVWLEGFYGSGWGTSTADLTRATLENFVMGHNLLALHGLYYSTFGGWWEWAPPCNGFRMPYWPHMGEFFKFVQRLSYVMSQGVHRCDVAILYPVTPVQADVGGNAAVDTAFEIARGVFDQGLDFDFMDDESLARAETHDGCLRVSGEQYRVLILPRLSVAHHSTLEQALRFYRAGGMVIAVGSLPVASDRAGRDDPAVDAIVRELFGTTQAEVDAGGACTPQRNSVGGLGIAMVQPARRPPRTYPGGFAGRWVWSTEPKPTVYFKAVWHAKEPARYSVLAFCDNEGAIFLNGQPVAHGIDYQKGWTGSLDLKDGDVITIDAHDFNDGRRAAGLFFGIVKDGRTVLSPEDLGYTLDKPDAAWRTSRDVSQLAKADLDNVHPLHQGLLAEPMANLVQLIGSNIERDFVPAKPCHVLHRKVGPRDVFLLTRAAGAECFFRTVGSAELWDPWTGRSTPLPISKSTPTGTSLVIPSDGAEAHLVVFSPTDGAPRADAAVADKSPAPAQKEISIEGPWEFELKPTLDNRWGDFRLPASATVIGPEARQFAYAPETKPDPGWEQPSADASGWPVVTCGFGPRFWKLGPVPDGPGADGLEASLTRMTRVDPNAEVTLAGREYAWRPYAYSHRYGIEGDPGHQGYHGLKSQVSDDFIALGLKKETMTSTVYEDEPDEHGHSASRPVLGPVVPRPEDGPARHCRYYLWTTVLAPRDIQAKVLMDGLTPGKVWLGGTEVKDLNATLALKAGATPLLLRYDRAGRGHFLLRDASVSQQGPQYPLAMSWYLMPGMLAFDPAPAESKPAGWYRFTAPPGLRAMTAFVRGEVQAWADGRQMAVERKSNSADGASEYRLTVAEPAATAVTVAMRVEQERGCYAGAALPEPIALECGPGQIALGDWSRMGALSAYSGGAWYRKSFTLTAEQAAARLTLDLGSVVSTAEVRLNGKSAGKRVAPPWRFDLSGLAQSGENRLEILVYSTLSNHYSTIPTRYRGALTAGLIGPVRVLVSQGKQ